MTDPVHAHATVATASASRYLTQLCKHFAHKITVDYDETSGRAEFAWGTCQLSAIDGALHLHLTAAGPEGLGRIKAVVEDHLVRFGWREALSIEWTDAA